VIFLAAFEIGAKLPPPERSFQKVLSNYQAMRSDSRRNKFRHHYIRHIRHFSTFNKVYKNCYNPEHEDALFYIASIYSDLAFASGKKTDFIIANNKLNNFIKRASKQDLIISAKNTLKRIFDYASKNNIPQITEQDKSSKDFGASLLKSFSHVNRINMFKNSITVHCDKKIKYVLNEKIISRKNSNRSSGWKSVTIDIYNSRLNLRTYKKPRLKVSVVKNLRVYQHNSKIVRIEFTTSKNLFPIITEKMNGKKLNFAMRTRNIVLRAKKELHKKIKILVDAGHGGKDPGTVKYGIKEKNVALAIAKSLGRLLKKEGLDVHYTRQKDVFLSLNERAKISKKINPDVFISIHSNSSRSKRASGIETYYFDVKSDRTTKRIAMRENKNGGPISDLDFILQDLTMSKNFIDAGKLASKVHNALISGISKEYKMALRNRGTRGGPFYLLYMTDVPSIIIEVGFLSNRREAMRLKTRTYQSLIAKQITSGIKSYMSIDKK